MSNSTTERNSATAMPTGCRAEVKGTRLKEAEVYHESFLAKVQRFMVCNKDAFNVLTEPTPDPPATPTHVPGSGKCNVTSV